MFNRLFMNPTLPIKEIITLSLAGMTAASCIFDAPLNDEFYRTLWTSDEVPLGPFEVSSLTMEFLCNECISITATSSEGSLSEGKETRTIYGTYHHDGLTASLNGLAIEINGYTLTFIEAHRNNDVLFLIWQAEDIYYPFTTALQRVTARP